MDRPRTRFHAILADRINKEVENRAASIISGACVDYAAYKSNTEYIRGLLEALKICEEIEREFDQ